MLYTVWPAGCSSLAQFLAPYVDRAHLINVFLLSIYTQINIVPSLSIAAVFWYPSRSKNRPRRFLPRYTIFWEYKQYLFIRPPIIRHQSYKASVFLLIRHFFCSIGLIRHIFSAFQENLVIKSYGILFFNTGNSLLRGTVCKGPQIFQ